MKRKHPYVLALLLIGAISILSGQAYLHTDKSFYVAGEVIWYKLYLPEPFNEKNLAVRVDVTDSNGVLRESYFLKSQGKTYLHGYYKTPYTLVQGYYDFRFFVAEEQGMTEKPLAVFGVPVYNDLQTPVANGTPDPVIAGSDPMPPQGGLVIELSPVQSTVHPGGTVDMSISVRDENGEAVDANMSVSVIDRNLIKSAQNEMVRGAEIEDQLQYIPLSSTLYHSGKIVGDNGEPLQGNVLGVYSSTENRMFYTKSNDEGDFIIGLPDYKGKKPVQMIGFIFEEHPSIHIVRNERHDPKSVGMPVYNEEIENYFEASRKRKKIYQFFKVEESPIQVEVPEIDVKQLKPNGTFNIKEYEDFRNIAEFFNELINSQLDFPKNRDGTFSARMYNPEGRGNIRHFTGDPIFIIDGKITRNADFIGKMSLDGIESVDLYFITKSIRDDFGTFGNSAFVFIHTTLPEINIPEEEEEDIFIVSGIQPEGKFLEGRSGVGDGYVPVFRPVIFWDPEVVVNNGKTEISFEQSDDVSDFEVIVVAQDAYGNLGSTSYRYSSSIQK